MAFLEKNINAILQNLGFEQLNQMQEATIEASKENSNLLLLANTGSGKTLAFLLSCLSNIEDKQAVQILILAPTRELVLQIESVIKQMKLPLKTNACYGGHDFSIERNNLSIPPSILIGTPGRIQDHLTKQTFDTSNITQLVFDEFDKSLEFGFTSQMESIVKMLPNVKRKILVSATKTIDIPEYLNFNKFHTINFEKESIGELSLFQIIEEKDEKLNGLLNFIYSLKQDENAIVFVNHREACDRISVHLDKNDIEFSIFHGGMKQELRELELSRFRNGSTQILIATDIAARGLDIPELDFVVHYQLPVDESSFTHRNGRTARMKSSGTSILIRTTDDKLPDYIINEPKEFAFSKNSKIEKPIWITLLIAYGKKDKINKIDIVGFLLQFDFMKKEDIGLIEVKDYSAFVAINRAKSKQFITASKNQKIKNKTTNRKLKLLTNNK